MIKNLVKSFFLNRWAAFIHDLLWIPFSLYCAYILRFNLEGIPDENLNSLWLLMAIAIPVQGIVYWFFGLYRGIWRFASLPDIIRIIKSVSIGTLLLAVIAVFANRLVGVPRSVFILYPVLLTIFLSLPRIIYRWHKDNRIYFLANDCKRVIIVGAGAAGELLLRDILYKGQVLPLAFIDDDETKYGREIHGIRVAGGVGNIASIAESFDVDELIIAIPSATKKQMQKITEACSKTKIPIRVLPSIYELSDQPVDFNQLRPIRVEDLLGREVIDLNVDAISSYLHDRVVLITGGGGSIGSELCRQISRQQPKCLVIFDNSEFNLYLIDSELKEIAHEVRIEPVLGDVRNKDRVNWVFETFHPEVIFHAAAYKHVPLVEMNPAEGVMNNVIGTKVLADTADLFKADCFVLVSTDKAVNPSNVMGTTKRVAELYCQNLAGRSETKYITTRFGNVLGSTGSVVPLFQKQIENGGPVTVTHDEITRYFMTIPESVSLILQAGSMGNGGEIFVLDMGEPIRIKDLAHQMIRLSGLEPEQDIKIKYIGLRPGEKLFEEILHSGEGLQATVHAKLLLARCRQVKWEWLIEELEMLEKAADSRDVERIIGHLKNIVPEFCRK